MKGLLLLILLFSYGLRAQEPVPPTPDSFYYDRRMFSPGDSQDYASFIEKLNRFNRKLGGCPPEGPVGSCVVGQGIFDAKLWKDLTVQAQRIFKLLPTPKK